MFIGFLSKHSQNKSSIKECTPPPNPYRSASIFRHKHLISCVDGWVGVVERAEGGECCSAPCHTFQCEQNKSICEVATGAECTFATGVCCVSPRASVCERVYVCMCVCVSAGATLVAAWLAGWSHWHLGCHWAAWLVSYVITKAWLHADMNKNV